MGQPIAAESDQIVFGQALSGAGHNQGFRRFAPLLMGDADHRAFQYGGMLVEGILDFRRTHVFAAGDDHILLAVDDMDRTGLVPDRQVAGVEEAVVDGGLGGFGLVVVAVEDRIGAYADLPHALVVPGHGVARVITH